MTVTRFARMSAVASALLTGGLLAEVNAASAAQKDGPDGRVLSLYSSGIDGLLVDSMDAGLRAALRRLIVDGPSLPPDTSEQIRAALDIVIPLLFGETAIAIDFAPSTVQGMPPFTFELTSNGVRGFSGESLLRRVQPVLLESNLREIGPDPDHAGVMKYQTGGDGPQMWMGADDGTFVISMPNAPTGDRDTFTDAGLPTGTDLLAGMRLNFSNLQAVMGMAVMADEGAAALLDSFGLMGPDAIDLVFALGGSDNAVHVAGRVSNYGTHFGHLIPSAGVTREQLSRVPQSAAWAGCVRFDLATYMSSLIQTLVDAGGPGASAQMEQACAKVQGMLGIDVHQDLLAPLGDAFTCYMSDETGGNGVMSMICMVSLKDADTMAATLHTLQKSIDRLATDELQGYVRVMRRDIHGCDAAVSLRFPGLPVPVEPTVAVARGQLVFGFFPQSVAAAVAQFGVDDSLLDAPGFRQVGGHAAIGAVEVVYLDERLRATEGYGCMALLSAAIDNYTRSRSRPEDVAAPVLPPFGAITGDMRAGIFIARMDGTDMVVSGSADRSLVAQVTAGLGQLGAVAPLLIPLGVAMVAPAMASSRRHAGGVARPGGASSAEVAATNSRGVPAGTQTDTVPQRRARLKTLSTALHLARGRGLDVHRLRDLVAHGYITRHELAIPGHPEARYLLVGGGALRTGDDEPCMIAEPGGLPIDRLCITPEGRIASMSVR